jgi:hypothetical protein
MDEQEIDIRGTVFDSMKIDDDTCFLCGSSLEAGMSSEHVFPRWLLRRHDLWNHELNLLNGTSIQYSQLKIPCCTPCNTKHLSILENSIRTAVEEGYEAVIQLPPLNLYQWMGKIYYGILRKELVLLRDRSDSEAGTIIPPELIESFSTLHLFLQSIRQPFQFIDQEPYSVLVANLHHRNMASFDFRDSLHPILCSLKTKDIGIIVALQDIGILGDSYGRYLEAVAGRKLLPIQFDELYAKCLYQMSLLDRIPKYVTIENKGPTVVHQMPIGGFSMKPVVKDWVQEDYASVLAEVLQQSHHKLDYDLFYSPPDQVVTWMSDDGEELVLFNAEGERIKN